MPRIRAFIALGANLADKRQAIAGAVRRMAVLPHTRVVREASVRETEPVGGPVGQPGYVNTAVELETGLSAAELMAALLEIEREMGRDRAKEERFGPRVIDLDILLYDDLVVEGAGLTLPHPRMHERRFVMEPMCDLAPEVVHPVLKKTMAEILGGLKG